MSVEERVMKRAKKLMGKDSLVLRTYIYHEDSKKGVAEIGDFYGTDVRKIYFHISLFFNKLVFDNVTRVK